MKRFIVSFLFVSTILFFTFSASLIKPTDKSPNLPPNFIQKSLALSSKTSKNTKKQLELIAKKYSSQAIEWWLSYKTSLILKQKDKKTFCNNMHFLSQIESFPLKDYADLHYYSYCNNNVTINLSDFPPWLTKRVAKKWHNKAQTFKNKSETMESAYQLYQLVNDKNEKEKYLVRAVKLAKTNQDPRYKTWQKQLYQLSPRYIKHPRHSEMLAVANDFRYVRRLKKARYYYRLLLNKKKSSFHEKNQAFKWLVWIYKDQKNKKRQLRATIQWKNWLKKKMNTHPQAVKTYHNIALKLARVQWTFNRSKQALKTLSQLKRKLKKRGSFFEIYRLKGLIFEEQKKINKSIIFLEKALKETPPDKEIKEKTWWRYGWVLYKAGRVQASINTLNNLLDYTKSDYLRSRILFWIGYFLSSINKEQKSQNIYKKLIKEDPLSYYGLLAHYKTKTKIQINKKSNSFDQWNKNSTNAQYTIAHWLISLGEYSAVQEFLKYKSQEYKKNKETQNPVELFYYMALAQFYLPLFQMAGSLPLEKRTIFFKTYTDLLFPTAYQKEISKAGQLFNIEKELIHALIRQESAYNPRARSPSDAFGLMQVRPFVARKIAKEVGLTYKGIKDLYKPEKNILIGTAFLKKQLKRYDFQFIVTLSAYNAGNTAVRRWLKQKPVVDPLLFIEEIPFEETRTYVRLLIRNFVFYKLLSHPDRNIDFPEWILHIKPSL